MLEIDNITNITVKVPFDDGKFVAMKSRNHTFLKYSLFVASHQKFDI